MLPFFDKLIGPHGVAVMSALEKSCDDLSGYITPRVIVGWLRQSDYGDVSLPDGCCISKLEKSGYGYSGQSKIQDQDYEFKYASEEHVAAIITTACGQTLSKCSTKDLDLAKLAKTIDLLIKATKLQYERTQRVQPLEPDGFVPPTTTQPKQVAKPTIPQLNKPIKKIAIQTQWTKPKRKKLTVWKSETSKPCSLCGQTLFENNKFVGCTCFKPLAKNITSSDDKLTITMEFDNDIDQDAMLALIGALKHGR